MAVTEKEVWIVKGSVKGMSRYPKQDTNVYDVRGVHGKFYQFGWFDPGWFGPDVWWPGQGSG